MARFSLRRYDSQAVASTVTAVAAAVAFLLVCAMVLQNADFKELIVHGGATRRMAILAGTALTMLLGAAGFGLGFNSVGQRQNNRQTLSWLGFFLSAAVMCGMLLIFAFFWLRWQSV